MSQFIIVHFCVCISVVLSDPQIITTMYYLCNLYHSMLSALERSSHMKHSHPCHLAEPHRQQQQQQPLIQQRLSLSLPQQRELMFSPSPQSMRAGGTVHIIYHMDSIPTPYHVQWNNTARITLRVFKERLFARKGNYRCVGGTTRVKSSLLAGECVVHVCWFYGGN